jgi:long-subunit fatty acid transport protein
MLELRVRGAVAPSSLRLAFVLALVACAAPSVVRANGLELLPGGARSVARGGAVAARPEDPMALIHNPAGLAFLPGDQFMLNVDVPIHDMCVDLYGYYGWGVYEPGPRAPGAPGRFGDFGDPLADAYATMPLPEVCNTGQIAPIPHIAWAAHLSDKFTLGLGMVAPTLVAGLQYGGEDGTISVDGEAFPTPTRYQLVRQRVTFALAPSVGAAYRVLPALSVGANLQIAMVRAESRAVQNATSGTNPAQDWLIDVAAEDYFIPAITFGVHARPLPALDLTASMRWVDTFDGSGEVVYETNTYHATSTQVGAPTPFRNDPVKLGLLQVGLPWTLTAGARYAGLLPGVEPSETAFDPMGRELWDVEIDVAYNLNERASENRVGAGEDVTVIVRDVGGGGDSQTVSESDLERLSVDRNLKDSIAVRIGGSYALLPRKLQLHAGSFYESRAIEPAYAHVESFAFQRVGVGVGVMARFGSWDLTAAYSHIFQETIEVAPPPHEPLSQIDRDDPTRGFDQRVGGTFADDGERVGGRVLSDPDAPEPGAADAVARYRQTSVLPSPVRGERVVNAGKYTAAFDVISVGATYRF